MILIAILAKCIIDLFKCWQLIHHLQKWLTFCQIPIYLSEVEVHIKHVSCLEVKREVRTTVSPVLIISLFQLFPHFYNLLNLLFLPYFTGNLPPFLIYR